LSRWGGSYGIYWKPNYTGDTDVIPYTLKKVEIIKTNFQEPTKKIKEMETIWRADPVKVMDNDENI
jgi:hypothetical protein